MIHQPLIVIPHSGLLLPPEVPMSEWTRMNTDDHDWGTESVYDMRGRIHGANVIKFPYSLNVVNVESPIDLCYPGTDSYYRWFYTVIWRTPKTYMFVGHSSRTGLETYSGDTFTADIEILSSENSTGTPIGSAPIEHAEVCAETVRSLCPEWDVQINTTYWDSYSAMHRHGAKMGVPTLSMEVNENLYLCDGKTDIAKLNLVNRVVAEAFKSVLEAFPA